MKKLDVYVYTVIALSIVLLLMGMVMDGLILFSHRQLPSSFSFNATILVLVGLVGVNAGFALKLIARQLG